MLIATHYIEKDRDLRAASRIHKQTESARNRQVVCMSQSIQTMSLEFPAIVNHKTAYNPCKLGQVL